MKLSTFLKSTFIFTAIIIFIVIHQYSFAADNQRYRKTSSSPIASSRCNQFTFDATGSYDPDNEDISFLWDFGDGQTSTEPIVTHIYDKSGEYEVTLSISDNSSLSCSTAVASQKVKANIPPFATFTSEDKACIDKPIIFDASASYDDSNEELGYEWNFGDGNRASNLNQIKKSYSKGGNYKVTLTVDDNSGTVCNTQSFEKVVFINEPPIAEAGEEVLLKCVSEDDDMVVTFDASNSSDVNNDQLSYEWDFGDGFSAEGIKVSHQYNEINNYDVKLIVKDNTNMGCGTSVDFVTVRLNHAPNAAAGDDVIACTGENIIFDGSNSFVYKKGTLSSKWVFGDGTSATGLKTEHIYSKPGLYKASLTVENTLNSMCPSSTDTRSVTINSTPEVSLKSPKSVCLGTEVSFDASSASDPDGDTLEYYWSFGDGNILRTGSKVNHTYEQGGNYRVSVIVDDGKGSTCSTATANTNIKVNTPPVANAGLNLSCCVDTLTEFNASASSDPDGDKLTYLWDFGDGSKGKGAVVNHKYTQSGSYNVVLTVDDNSGTPCSKSTAGFVAEVNSTPVPVINIR